MSKTNIIVVGNVNPRFVVDGLEYIAGRDVFGSYHTAILDHESMEIIGRPDLDLRFANLQLPTDEDGVCTIASTAQKPRLLNYKVKRVRQQLGTYWVKIPINELGLIEMRSQSHMCSHTFASTIRCVALIRDHVVDDVAIMIVQYMLRFYVVRICDTTYNLYTRVQ